MTIDETLLVQTSNTANAHRISLTEETCQKKTLRERILSDPDTHVGSTEKHTQDLWVFEGDRMVYKRVTYVPAFYRIFDEILVNAADIKQRDEKMDSVKVDIDVERNIISVYNNGDGVPVEMHQAEGLHVPEMIFGDKLANIFATEFDIQIADGKRKKMYEQVFFSSMGTKSEPSISKCKASENWTRVTFKPDLARFNMTHLEDDVVALMKKRVVDLAGCLGKTLKVELNGGQIPVKSFFDYVNLYLQSASKNGSDTLPRITGMIDGKWEICVSVSEGQFQQVSFVNAIATIKGGTHVDYVANQVATHLMNTVFEENKNANLKAHMVKNHLWVFVNAHIYNPAFDSKMKETLTTSLTSFGRKFRLSQDFLENVAKSGVVENLLSWAGQRMAHIPELEDAHYAGSRDSDKCTLILAQDSAVKALAMAGISVVGRDYYGVFRLSGEFLNIRKASGMQILENVEIQSIVKILGLQVTEKYDSVNKLRYGKLMIMTDQGYDGSHIKGLLINFIHSFWRPLLLKDPFFLSEFTTPIMRVTHRKSKSCMPFYSMPDYESWLENLGGNTSGWDVKYYKGLGDCTLEEGKEYFSDLQKHRRCFMLVDEQDSGAIDMAFGRMKKNAETRKSWLKQHKPGTSLDQEKKSINQEEKSIRYKDFVNKEFLQFSIADLQHSIPSVVDGLKLGQRKILFSSFKCDFVKEATVAQISGYVSEHSAYHHGEASLVGTSIGMAQDFVGSNNINLLQLNGQFGIGTRNLGNKYHASACLSPITRFLFPKDDDILLDYLMVDGQPVEPTWYVPVIPTVLVNGSESIGKGLSTFIPNYSPRDIIANLKRLLNGEPMVSMDPWYKGFKGKIEKKTSMKGDYIVTGVIEERNETTLWISELPVLRWTHREYKQFLESMLAGNDKVNEPFIKDYIEHYVDGTTVLFEVKLSKDNMEKAKKEGLVKKFKLTGTISTGNMHLFDSEGAIKKYDNPEQILEDFYDTRLGFYQKRKRVLLENIELELKKLDNKVKYICGVMEKKIPLSENVAEMLHQKGFDALPKNTKKGESSKPEEDDYEYLLSLPFRSLTRKKVEELFNEKLKLEGEMEDLKHATPKSLWRQDLESLEKKLDEQDVNDRKEKRR